MYEVSWNELCFMLTVHKHLFDVSVLSWELSIPNTRGKRDFERQTNLSRIHVTVFPPNSLLLIHTVWPPKIHCPTPFGLFKLCGDPIKGPVNDRPNGYRRGLGKECQRCCSVSQGVHFVQETRDTLKCLGQGRGPCPSQCMVKGRAKGNVY